MRPEESGGFGAHLVKRKEQDHKDAGDRQELLYYQKSIPIECQELPVLKTILKRSSG